MSCHEHECMNCDFWTSNNKSRMDCPNCGERCMSFFDEADDKHDNYDHDECDDRKETEW